jgi:TfdA family taurine catabolism dioxygenase TauD
MTSASTPNSLVLAPISGGWHGSELAADPRSWRVPLPSEVRDDLLHVAADLGPGGISADPRQPRPQVGARTRSLVADLYRRLADEPGVVVLTGFPVTEGLELTETAYLLLGKLLGQPVGQIPDGNPLARVEATGLYPNVIGMAGLVAPTKLPFHVDGYTDLIGLLCIRPAQAGGLSRLISSRAVHNALLARHPDLLSALYQPIPLPVPEMRGSDGEPPPGWREVPMFSQVNGHFGAYYSRRLVERGQGFPDAPRVTQQVTAALDIVDELAEEPGMALETTLQVGDLLLSNNLTSLHARTAYEEGTGQGRLLLRSHLAFAGSPALPAGYAAIFGAEAAGTYRGGHPRTREVRKWLGTPLRAGGVS